LEDSAESVIAALTAAFAAATGVTAAPRSAHAHRWRYALADAPLGEPFLWDAEQKLGLCGDWCLAPRLEAAYLSATALGKTMLNDI
jgi:predicted NAD/FAD-dependent oxidoreductase